MTKTDDILANIPEFMDKETSSNNYKFVNSFESEFDYVISQVENLKKAIRLSTAVGTELDDIGEIFLLSRKGSESDNNFRARIQAYWPGFSGGGTQNSLKQAIVRMTDIEESDITITEYATALKFKVSATVPSFGTDITTVQTVLNKSKAAGTYIVFDLNTSLTEYYKLYTETINIIPAIYILSDWTAPDDSKVPL